MTGVRHLDGPGVKPELILAGLDASGAVLLHGLDPGTPDAMLRLATAVGSLDTGIDEVLLGPRVMDIRYDAAKIDDEMNPAYFTANHFPLHTDVSYVPTPPKYMLMHCVAPDPAGGGACLLSQCEDAFQCLGPEDQVWLTRAVYRFRHPPNCPIGESPPRAIREADIWRFKYGCMRCPDNAVSAVERFFEALVAVSFALDLQRGDLLIVDNHRVAHGRTSFPVPPDRPPERHMRRTYAAARTHQPRPAGVLPHSGSNRQTD